MAMTIEQLRAASDDDLIQAHDQQAVYVNPGVDYYLDELRRRDQARAMKASHQLAIVGLILSVVNAVVAVVAVVVALSA